MPFDLEESAIESIEARFKCGESSEEPHGGLGKNLPAPQEQQRYACANSHEHGDVTCKSLGHQ